MRDNSTRDGYHLKMPNRPSLGREPFLTAPERTILLTQALEARSMHEVWMQRGRAFLAGKQIDFPPDFAMRDDLCPIGAWLRERLDPRLKTLELYDRTSDLHNEFHLVMGRLFKEDVARVSGGARAEFQRVGDALTDSIEAWISLARGKKAR